MQLFNVMFNAVLYMRDLFTWINSTIIVYIWNCYIPTI